MFEKKTKQNQTENGLKKDKNVKILSLDIGCWIHLEKKYYLTMSMVLLISQVCFLFCFIANLITKLDCAKSQFVQRKHHVQTEKQNQRWERDIIV